MTYAVNKRAAFELKSPTFTIVYYSSIQNLLQRMTSHVTSGALNAADMSDTSNNSHRKACSFAQAFQEDTKDERLVWRQERPPSIKHEQQSSLPTHRSYLCRRLRSYLLLTKPYDLCLSVIRSPREPPNAAQLICDALTAVTSHAVLPSPGAEVILKSIFWKSIHYCWTREGAWVGMLNFFCIPHAGHQAKRNAGWRLCLLHNVVFRPSRCLIKASYLFRNRARRFTRIFHQYYSNGQENKAALSPVAVTPYATPSGSTARCFVPTRVTLIFSARRTRWLWWIQTDNRGV